MAPASPPFAAWHEFFALIGAAAATLIAAMFVVVSIGAGMLTPERGAAVRTFLTATIAHLSAVLFGGALTLVPGLDRGWFGALVGLAGLAGLVQSARNMVGFGAHPNTDRSDFFWYAMVPPVGYAALVAAGVAVWRWPAPSLDLLAVALSLLLAAGIRNAWDMIVFFVLRSRGDDS